ncbi:bifunctional diaminohydroxyphosphoribosylaminopyrimidine deaminase/5-amino-6-(5-phosphoribosylamino)uracil reductase RibD [bacterium]|nr:bifunctional diaminohydroxyphosphoribosylaminopyrimidine deaminase/5-amino-6-(5-phosphoribosylamino)uracil reductase RibD [bacterium]
MTEKSPEYYMSIAIENAYKAFHNTTPNPSVGCVIVKNGEIISEGYHHKAGMPHAEIDALSKIDFNAKDCDLYVTLEPCNHYGKTPPCTEAIIKSGAKRVFISITDPNPIVNGSGIKRLEEAGVEVVKNILLNEGEKLLSHFKHHIKYKTPFVTLKAAITLNGMINEKIGSRSIITSKETSLYTKKLREEHHSTLVGINTILVDNPSFEGVNLIVIGNRTIPSDSKIFQKALSVTQISTQKKMKQSDNHNLITLDNIKNSNLLLKNNIKQSDNHIIDLNIVLKTLFEMRIGSILVEGGNSIFNQFIETGNYNKLCLYMAPKIFGGDSTTPFYNGFVSDLKNLKFCSIQNSSEDIILELEHNIDL